MSQFHQLALKQAVFEDHVHGQHWVWKTSDKCDTLVSDRCDVCDVVGCSRLVTAWRAERCGWRTCARRRTLGSWVGAQGFHPAHTLAPARCLGRRPGFPSSSPRTGLAAQRQIQLLAVVSHIGAEASDQASQEIHVVTMRGPIHMMMMTRQTGQVQQQEAGVRQCKHNRCKKNSRLTLSANCQDKCSTRESLHPTMRVRLRERRKTVHLHKLMQNSPT